MTLFDLKMIFERQGFESFETDPDKIQIDLETSGALQSDGRASFLGETIYFVHAGRTSYPFNPNNLSAFSFRIRGRTSSRMAIFSKSAIQRSGVIKG
jgi:hypothetical protein